MNRTRVSSAAPIVSPRSAKPAAKQRRTQGERSSATRSTVNDAIIQCLFEQGYAGTTMATVTEAARVSRGAITHQFGTKREMLVAAVENLAARTDAELHEVVRESEREHGLRHRQLLSEMFGADVAEHPNFRVALDLTFNLMRGMALTGVLRENPTREEELLNQWSVLFHSLVSTEETLASHHLIERNPTP